MLSHIYYTHELGMYVYVCMYVRYRHPYAVQVLIVYMKHYYYVKMN